MITLHKIQQGTDEWHELRAGKYTGSNAHKLLKYGAISYSKTSDNGFTGNFFTKRGHILEDEAIELYELIKKLEVNRVGFVTNSEFNNCGYSPDGLLEDRTIEVKAFNEDRHKANMKELEFEILAQAYFGQVICKRKITDVLLYNPDLEAKDALFIKTIKYNRAIHSNIKRLLKNV